MSRRAAGDQVRLSSVPTDIDGVDDLVALALDLRSSWYHDADALWRQLDTELWEVTHNPWVVLQTVSRDTLLHHLSDATFRKEINKRIEARRKSDLAPSWFQETHTSPALRSVAYFSMEFMLSETLPIYSGGLGNVAGDQLKAANDLGVPITGVGLLYQQGYFRQIIGPDGRQHALYPYNDPGQLPITPLRDASGEWLRLRFELPGHSIWVRAWQARVGRLKLFLLDTNDAANHPPYRAITSELYGGGRELRLMQELVLGVCGWQLLVALGVEPEVCHLNERHAALVVLERARQFMIKTGRPFDAALSTTRAGNLFTTHTAVPAGFDRFPPDQIRRYLGEYAETQLGITQSELLALGREDPNDTSEEFNMALLAIHGCGAVNGVSRLHGEVSRGLFSNMFPRWPQHEVPVGHVTNGVHSPTWDSELADKLWTEACGKQRWLGQTDDLHADICCIPDEELWEFRNNARAALTEYVHQRLSTRPATSVAPAEKTRNPVPALDPNTLTLGFARRFATYKRPNLLLRYPERLLSLLNHPEHPVQLILAGKAHPADFNGQALIREWIEFSQLPEAAGRVVFLDDYDMHVAEHLVQGVDVWLNTPRRPWEASGTSGMKVLVNGGVNLSELDGWWAEAYTPDVGWALGDREEHGSDAAWDAKEAGALFELLEREVVPQFYTRDEQGIPRAWVARMRNSMAHLTPYYSTNRTIREYTEQYYWPAATAYQTRAAKKGKLGAQIAKWRQNLDQKWKTLRFGTVEVEAIDEQHVFNVSVYFGDVSPNDVQVELYADALSNGAPVRTPLHAIEKPAVSNGRTILVASVPANRPANDFTARIVPKYAGVSVPLEAPNILWQR